jgi:hypothetical protein
MQHWVNTRLLRQIEGRDVNFFYLSDHPDLTLEVLQAFPAAPWDWESVQHHDNMCLEWLSLEAPWDYYLLTELDQWTFEWVERFPDRPWHWNMFHLLPGFCIDWVAKFPGKPWNMHEISRTPTIRDITKYPDLPWHWAVVTWASPVTTKDMILWFDLPWDFSEFEMDYSLEDAAFLVTFQNRLDWTEVSRTADWALVCKFPDLPWDWYHVMPEGFEERDIELLEGKEVNWKNFSWLVPFSVIVAHPELPWRAEWVSMNETLTFNDLPGPFNWDWSFVPCEPVPDIVRKWIAASTIKRQFRESISNPDYLMCRNRVLREYHEEISLLADEKATRGPKTESRGLTG